MDISILFGMRVRQLRMERKFSQEKLAELSGLHRTYIGAVERGEKNITIRNAKKIAVALSITLSELIRNYE